MSGVMLKTAIYGIIRVIFDLIGSIHWQWGVVLLFGAATSLFGVLFALMQHDLKRLLAYHSVENIGIILIGLGLSLIFIGSGHPVLAALALIAGLYHTLNHAVFKGLLFLGAGSILQSTGKRDLDEMGGLIRSMPHTAVFFLIGALSISALPPLNGFVSEWLTFQAAALAGAVEQRPAQPHAVRRRSPGARWRAYRHVFREGVWRSPSSVSRAANTPRRPRCGHLGASSAWAGWRSPVSRWACAGVAGGAIEDVSSTGRRGLGARRCRAAGCGSRRSPRSVRATAR